MELRYSFDPQKWYLGTLCRKGHRWPGTDLSIRRNYKGAAQCAGCATDPEAELPWLFRFIDLEASGVPAGHRLGKLCAKGHSWSDTGYTLRKHRHCVECEKERTRPRTDAYKASQQRHYQANRERLIEEAKQRRLRRIESGEYQAYRERTKDQRNAYKRCKRAEAGAKPRGTQEEILLRAAIKRAGRLPSVARLVYQQQFEHWRNHPQDRAEFMRQYGQWRHHWNYAMSLEYRLYHRAKSKLRKARERGSRTVMLSGNQLWRRWVEFDHRCAYCGASGDLQVEHVIPISKGGEHHLGNIVPACQRCNFSKGKQDAETWYRKQSHFDETRWTRIVEALAKAQPQHHQPSLLNC
jgi:5-methylcytosine-specific restriction endonuclease McrA